jgi:hypothetical protein
MKINYNITPEQQIDLLMHSIIDETHPWFQAITDEQLLETNERFGRFTRDFLHKSRKKFRMEWCVYYGTPETVTTVFSPAIEI